MIHFIWLGFLLSVLILDLETSNVLFSWLGIGFIAAFILGYFGVGIEIQGITALVLSIPLFLLGSHISKKYIKANIIPYENNLDKLIDITIISKTSFEEEGKQKISGVYWKLISDTPIKEGDKIKITGRDGNRLIVEKI